MKPAVFSFAGTIGRLERKTWYNASPTPTPVLEVEYTYDEYGQVEQIDVDECGGGCGETIYYGHDNAGRLTSRTGHIDDIEYDYDAAGRMIELTYPVDEVEDLSWQWGYDRASRVVAVTEAGQAAPIVEYRYNRASQRTHADYENLAYSRWEYDPTFGHLDQVTHYDGDDEVLSSFEYTYDLDGLRTKVTREDGDYIDYDYDGLSRLTDEHCKDDQGQTQWRRQYQYDKVGNRTQFTKTDGANSQSYSYSYNGLGQMETLAWYVGGQPIQWDYTYDANGNLIEKERWIMPPLLYDRWTYEWDAQDRLVSVERDDNTGTGEDVRVEYKYCQTCGGAMSERIEYASDGFTIVSWLRYEYDGLNLLRIDEKYDGETPAGLDENDPWRPLNVFIHGPGAIGQIVKCKWYNYASDGQNPTSCCDSGEYYYFYDALGNVNGVLDEGGHYYRWEMDAFGNDLPSGNSFLAMDQPGAKEHLTGKMFDTTTGLYYFAARWYDPQVGRFVSRDPVRGERNPYAAFSGLPTGLVDPTGTKSCYYIARSKAFGLLPLAQHPKLVQYEIGITDPFWVSAELAEGDDEGYPWENLKVELMGPKHETYNGKGQLIECKEQCLAKIDGTLTSTHKWAFYAWLRMIRPKEEGELFPRPWGNVWHLTQHNCNHYLNQLLDLCQCSVRISYDGREIEDVR